MKDDRSILREAYVRLARRVGVWAGLFAVVSTFLVTPAPSLAAANQLTSRKATLSTSAVSATTDNVTFSFTFGSSYTVKGITVDMCTSPLPGTCTQPSSGSLNSVTSVSGQTGGCASFAFSAKTATNYSINFATGNAVTSASTCTFTLNGVTNPNTSNYQFYFRITTWTDTAYSLPSGGQDFGGIAVSTDQTITVSDNVQEDLRFCIGAGVTTSSTTPCSSPGAATVTLSPNPMTISAPSFGTMPFAVSTNATSGYVVTYVPTSFTSSGGTITDAGASTVAAAGTASFGFTLRAQTSGAASGQGSNPVNGTGVAAGNYNLLNSTIAYQSGDSIANSAGAPAAYTTFTILYVADVGALTKAGIYNATQNFIATGTF